MSKKKEVPYLVKKVCDAYLADEAYLDALTIIEQLKQQLAEKDKEISQLKQKLEEKQRTLNEVNKAYIETFKREREKDKEIEFMAMQLTPHQKSMSEICACYDRKRESEKDALKERIKQLEREVEILSRNQIQNLNHDKDQRHQICEEFRKKYDKLCEEQDNIDWICTYGIEKILDQIEKGE